MKLNDLSAKELQSIKKWVRKFADTDEEELELLTVLLTVKNGKPLSPVQAFILWDCLGCMENRTDSMQNLYDHLPQEWMNRHEKSTK